MVTSTWYLSIVAKKFTQRWSRRSLSIYLVGIFIWLTALPGLELRADIYLETATHAQEHNMTSKTTSIGLQVCAVLHFGSNVISGNKCVRREPLVLWGARHSKHAATQYNIWVHRVGFQILPNSFFVILTRVISSQSPCNPISQLLSLVVDSHAVTAQPILVLPLERGDSGAMAFGLFRVDLCFPSSLGLTSKASAFALNLKYSWMSENNTIIKHKWALARRKWNCSRQPDVELCDQAYSVYSLFV